LNNTHLTLGIYEQTKFVKLVMFIPSSRCFSFHVLSDLLINKPWSQCC